MTADAVAAIARQVFLYWLLLPLVGIPLGLIARRHGQTGFLSRVGVWLLLVPLVLGVAYLGRWPFFILVCATAAAGSLELARVTRSYTVSIAGSVIVCAALFFWMRLQQPADGFRFVAFGFSIVVINDMFGFVLGRFAPAGRPFPRLSPGKTWSGYAGGLTAAVAFAQVGAFMLPELTRVELATLGLALAISGSLGDLAASAVKRHYGVKDFGRTLGAMGGILDRIDSLLAAGWVFWLLLQQIG